ncbi:MAG: alanine/ornithine racemase family PLP-dependent enzyme, partial [Gammaproteobacteria bacterium]|nr:alanine/ornithine racemase family PLP-dependent enzyme [Gammaproteobacteria bacterium]
VIEESFGIRLDIVSGGNSGNLQWALGTKDTGRINDLRLGEAVLLGCETLQRQAIAGLYSDAFTLVAEVIESKVKPAQPWGELAQTAYGTAPSPSKKQGLITQSILAIGLQDTDTAGLLAPEGMEILGASSDHLIIDAGRQLAVGLEIRFQLNYSALVRAMTSPFVARVYSDSKSLKVA